MENPCERSSLLLGLGLTPGEQLGEAGGTGGTVQFLVLARGSGLKELPALPLTALPFPGLRTKLKAIPFFCLRYPPSVLWMSSPMVFALDGTSALSGSPLLQDAHRECSAFSPSGFVGVGLWLRPAGLGRSPHHPDEIGSVIH